MVMALREVGRGNVSRRVLGKILQVVGQCLADDVLRPVIMSA